MGHTSLSGLSRAHWRLGLRDVGSYHRLSGDRPTPGRDLRWHRRCGVLLKELEIVRATTQPRNKYPLSVDEHATSCEPRLETARNATTEICTRIPSRTLHPELPHPNLPPRLQRLTKNAEMERRRHARDHHGETEGRLEPRPRRWIHIAPLRHLRSALR